MALGTLQPLRTFGWLAVALLAAWHPVEADSMTAATQEKIHVKPLAIQEEHLDNGLTVLIQEDHSTPIVSVQVWYKVGSRNEKSGATGLAHMLEHMLFKGTKGGQKPEEFAQLIQKMGGVDNAFTSNDFTAYFSNIPSARLDYVLSLYADQMTGALIADKEFLSEREVVYEEYRLRDNSPYGRVYRELYAGAFTAHPYHWPVIGWHSDIENWTSDVVRGFYQQYYQPNNSILVLVGDVDPASAMKAVKEHFASLPKGPVPPTVHTTEPEQAGLRRINVRKEDAVPSIFAGFHIPAWDSPDQYPLSVLSSVLSDGKSSRLYNALVYQKQLALAAGGGNDEKKDPSLFFAYAIANPAKDIKDCEEALFSEIYRLKTEPVTDWELQKAKNKLLAGFLFEQEMDYMKGMNIGKYAALGDYRAINEFPDKIQEVTVEQVREAAKKYFDEDHLTIVTLLPKPKAQKAEAGTNGNGSQE